MRERPEDGYDPGAFEAGWQERWRAEGAFRADDRSERPPLYLLEFFPYPSGAGLSVGHCRNYVPADIYCRMKRMQGFEVLHPMGWDAFGQPAENEAIRRGRHPAAMVAEYAARYRRTLESIGCSYDWERELSSSDPAYYRHTQALFLLLHRRGLAYRAEAAINWCPGCQTGLANEEVLGGRCWRCDAAVEERPRRQWFFRITDYARRLADGLDGLDWPDGIKAAQRDWIGDPASPRMRDWLVSRQRYWGCPIPMVECARCGLVTVPEAELPVLLPPVERYEPTGTGDSPLAAIPEFVRTRCPACGGEARRETDTMAGFACSAWYFLRFCDPRNPDTYAAPELIARWGAVDRYCGGAEHAVAHLLYARFVTKVLHDAGIVPFAEPFRALRNQGSLLAWTPGIEVADGPGGRRFRALAPEEAAGYTADELVWRWARMSKSRGNVVRPEEVIALHGADALRVYIAFAAAFADDMRYDPDGVAAAARFLARVRRLVTGVAAAGSTADADPAAEAALRRATQRAIAAVTATVEGFRFNSAVAELMTLQAAAARATPGSPAAAAAAETLVVLLAPFAPHLADELWTRSLGREGRATAAAWPQADPALAAEPTQRLAVQVDGRVRGEVELPAGAGEEEIRAAALAHPSVTRHLDGRAVARVIVVPGRLVSVVSGS
ncbi:MAG TPA: class I tRNA ligase family protein [Gaiellales bacterium]|nr:class I tRNA ligase family protein [Gaiellales bacterium]